MNDGLTEFMALDAPALLALVFASVSCAMLGNFLVLRRLSLMGDAIAHAVLPGLVLAFLVTAALGHPERARDPLIMMAGAALSGIVTVVLVEFIHRIGNVEKGAAMGVAFSVMFALGVLLLEQAAARHVDLDADCVLYGQLESLMWLPTDSASGYFSWSGIADLPRQVITLMATTLLVMAFALVFHKELRIAAFDPGLARTLGLRPQLMHYALMILVAVAAVAAFEAVGSILVIALLICPAATARLLTDSYRAQIVFTILLAIIGSAGGYFLGTRGPMAIGFDHAVNAAGMVTVAFGVLLAAAILLAPRYGVLARAAHRWRLSIKVLREDLLGLLYRVEEHGQAGLSRKQAAAALRDGPLSIAAIFMASRRGELDSNNGNLQLTAKGRQTSQSLIRSHRLWESYLVNVLGLRPDHVHDTAMRLEHIIDAQSGRRLAPTSAASVDPHNKPIPLDRSDQPPDADSMSPTPDHPGQNGADHTE